MVLTWLWQFCWKLALKVRILFGQLDSIADSFPGGNDRHGRWVERFVNFVISNAQSTAEGISWRNTVQPITCQSLVHCPYVILPGNNWFIISWSLNPCPARRLHKGETNVTKSQTRKKHRSLYICITSLIWPFFWRVGVGGGGRGWEAQKEALHQTTLQIPTVFWKMVKPVSYTHLTLPTKLSV